MIFNKMNNCLATKESVWSDLISRAMQITYKNYVIFNKCQRLFKVKNVQEKKKLKNI